MFKKNTQHLQSQLFSTASMLLPTAKQKKLEESKEKYFYELIFCQIREEDFAVLYSDKASRPNAPINAMVASLILKHLHNWSYEELFDHIDFDLRTRKALGLQTLDEQPFVQASIFNFQNRIASYAGETGINLFEQVFDHLTGNQLKQLKIKTNIQRTDSFAAASNIASLSRIQLLVEVLIRLYRVLSEEDKGLWSEYFSPFVSQKSNKYVYGMKKEDYPHTLEKLGELYHKIVTTFKDRYEHTQIWEAIERVYTEHFSIVSEQVQVKTAAELHSGCLQSPDDLEATYRKKRGESSKGRVISITETASPDNALQLITDVSVVANNVDDSTILHERLDGIKAKSPDLEEIHFDGGYGSEGNDKKLEELEIVGIQTAVKGREATTPITLQETEDTEGKTSYTATCPGGQTVQAAPMPQREKKGRSSSDGDTVEGEAEQQRYKAVFCNKTCSTCPHAAQCKLQKQKQGRVYRFSKSDVRKQERHAAIMQIPPERRKIRPNVEASVQEFSHHFNHKGKLRVRGTSATELFAYTRATAINFGRIFRYLTGENSPIPAGGMLCSVIFQLFEQFLASIQTIVTRILGNNLVVYSQRHLRVLE